MKHLHKQLFIGIAFFVWSTNSILAQTENCSVYGNDPKDFRGQKCWMENYLSSYIWKYNNNQRVDTNFNFTISREELNSYLNYKTGVSNFYLDVNNMAWGSFWYPCASGGIANRYHSQYGSYPKSSSLNWENIKTLDSVNLLKLSPAEKLDILLGDKEFSITKWELQHRGPERPNHDDDGFCGYCNGSRLAGALLPEVTHNITVKSFKDKSIVLTFTPSDIKAIAAAAYMHPRFYAGIGFPDRAGKNDPNPALLDILLRLYLAQHKMPFFIDADPGPDLYNETVIGFDRNNIGERNLTAEEIQNNEGAFKAIKIRTTLYLQDELNISQSNSPTVPILVNKEKARSTFSNAATYYYWVHSFEYEYELFINTDGKIVNGKWIIDETMIPESTKLINGVNVKIKAHKKYIPVDFLWMANGGGNEENSEFANNPGNKFLKFDPIIYLVELASKPKGSNEAPIYSPPSKINQSSINNSRQFQTPPSNINN